MKIISGEFKGRRFKELNIDTTRPTMDRVKESLFGMIQDYLPNSTVLDLFSGSGSLGFESLSNGAKYVYFNDINIKCVNYIKELSKTLKLDEKTKIFNMDFKKVLNYLKSNNISVDIIFLDPPYSIHNLNEVIKLIKEYNLLNKEGIIVCEVDSKYIEEEYFTIIKERKYSDKYIIILKDN